jgi:tetratricopeptide (TPR) repeat protein
MGRYDQAIEDYNRVLSMRSDDSNAYASRGVALLNKAIADFKKACDMGNRNACDNLKEVSGKK